MKKLSISSFAILAIVFSLASAFTTKKENLKGENPFSYSYRLYFADADLYDRSDIDDEDANQSLTSFISTEVGLTNMIQVQTGISPTGISSYLDNVLDDVVPFESNEGDFTFEDYCPNSPEQKICLFLVRWENNTTADAVADDDKDFGIVNTTADVDVDYILGDFTDPNDD